MITTISLIKSVFLTIDRFRWVACQLDYLCGFSSDFERRQALGQLPPTLHETYLRVLQRLTKFPTSTQSKIQMCFQFIAFCPKRLTTRQLREAISTPEILGAYLNDDIMVSEEDVSSMCGSLLKKSADGESFEFAHFSVREFLEHQSLAKAPDLEDYRISQSECYRLLAIQSLRYLQLSNFVLDPPDLQNVRKHTYIISGGKDDGYSFHQLAARYSLEMMPHADSQSIMHALMNSLFHPSKTSCLILFTTSLCFPLIEYCSGKGLIGGDIQMECHDLARRVVNADFHPIHLAAALNLPSVCEYLISTGSNFGTICSFGAPFELSVTSLLRLVLDGHDWTTFKASHQHLRGPIHSILSTGVQRKSTVEILERTSSETMASEQSLQLDDLCMSFPACIIAFVQNDFLVLQRLLARGMTLKDSIYTTVFRDLMRYSFKSIERDAEPLIGFLQYVGTLLEPESGWQLEIGREIWNTAVDLGLPFTRDPTLTDFRITLSKDALLSRTFATIKDHDLQGLQECLLDGRLDLLERYRSPWQPHDDHDVDILHLTLLHFAVLEDNTEATSYLAKAGCDPNIPSVRLHHRWLPIHDCCSTDVFEALVVCGAQATAVEAHTGHNLWHLYVAYPAPEIKFFNFLATRYPSETAEALLTKSKDGYTPLQLALVPRPSPVPREVTVDRVMALIGICQEVDGFWSSHDPLLGIAAEFGSEIIIRRLVEFGARSDTVGPGLETPLHRLSIESSSGTVQYLKELYPGALDMRFANRLPLQLYLERCCRYEHPVDDTVAQDLSSFGSLESIDGDGTMLWDHYCNSTPSRQQSYRNTKADYRFIWGWLLGNDSAIKVYESSTGRSGLPLLFSRFISLNWTQELDALISPHVLGRAIEASLHWESAKIDPSVLRFLQFLIRNQCYELVDVLLGHGVSVSEPVDHYSSIQIACQSPLAISICSAEEGKDMLQKMLDLANPMHLNDHGKDGLTILHRLATVREDAWQLHWLIETLLTKGVDIDKKEQFGRGATPIVHHITRRSLSCAEFLLQMGADPGIAEHLTPDAAMEASYHGFRTFLDRLLEPPNPQRQVVDWQRTININMVVQDGQKIILNNAKVVHLTAWGGHVECMAFFVDNNLIDDLEAASVLGWTVMHVSAMQGNPRMMEFLYSNGCKVMPQTVDRVTPLHLAVQRRKYDACRTLIRLGAQDVPDVTGMTPTMLASKDNDESMVRLLKGLLSSEAEVPRQLGSNLPHKAPTALLTTLSRSIQFGDIEECKRLFAVGCPINTSIKGSSPLTLALHHGQLDIAEWLLDNGADTAVRMCQDADEERCFNVIEICLGHPELCKLLPKLVDHCIHDGSGWPHLDNFSFSSAIRNENIEGLSTLLSILEQKTADIR